ncbi:unnamed protein product [Sphagnum jensenii]|uniref:Uncharacterized protein n=1 Tax=Sphagnum jensenii TaxID=128206 RepID=A0ABP1BAH7_9BRYO
MQHLWNGLVPRIKLLDSREEELSGSQISSDLYDMFKTSTSHEAQDIMVDMIQIFCFERLCGVSCATVL